MSECLFQQAEISRPCSVPIQPLLLRHWMDIEIELPLLMIIYTLAQAHTQVYTHMHTHIHTQAQYMQWLHQVVTCTHGTHACHIHTPVHLIDIHQMITREEAHTVHTCTHLARTHTLNTLCTHHFYPTYPSTLSTNLCLQQRSFRVCHIPPGCGQSPHIQLM